MNFSIISLFDVATIPSSNNAALCIEIFGGAGSSCDFKDAER